MGNLIPLLLALRPLPIAQNKIPPLFNDWLLSSFQILFLLGLTLIIGLQKTAVFFARRQKLKGTAAFAAGITLILLRWPLIGFLVELYGIFVLFGDFFATIASFAGNIPVIGPYIEIALNRIRGGRRNAELPVWSQKVPKGFLEWTLGCVRRLSIVAGTKVARRPFLALTCG